MWALAVETLGVLGQVEVEQRQVLREAHLVGGVHGDGGVDHVGRSGPLDGREHVQRQAVLGVHPRAEVALEELQPRRVPAVVGAGALGVLQAQVDLAHHRGVVAVDRLVPLLVGVEERMPVRRTCATVQSCG